MFRKVEHDPTRFEPSSCHGLLASDGGLSVILKRTTMVLHGNCTSRLVKLPALVHCSDSWFLENTNDRLMYLRDSPHLLFHHPDAWKRRTAEGIGAIGPNGAVYCDGWATDDALVVHPDRGVD